jgi:hypothetical protein
MSLAAALADRPERPAPPRRGRPPVAGLAPERDRHNVCAQLLLLRDMGADDVAGLLSISRSAVYHFTHRAMGYPGPLSVALRTAARARGLDPHA